MLQWWKVKREIKRFGLQIAELKPFFLGPFNRLFYDTFMSKDIRLAEGNRPALSDLAVVLIYQPEGICESTFYQLEHLARKSVSPVLVSNAPISERDMTHLKSLCYLIIERPNFGYDFGGYRDAILEILKRTLKINNLFVLNDSIWFPIIDGCHLIEDARASSSDLFGIFYVRKSRKRQHWHLHSYFYRFGGELVSSQTFHQYWKTMPLYQGAKRVVIRQFETKLTAYFETRGYTVASLFDSSDVRSATKNLTKSESLDLVRYNLNADSVTRSLFEGLEGASPVDKDWEDKLQSIIDHRKFGNYYLHAHPWVFLKALRSPILKKNRDKKFVAQRKEIVRTGLGSELLPFVEKEVSCWDD